MVLLTPRVHFFEINDQSWFPAYFRAKVQACLTLLWTFRVPLMQPTNPAELVAKTLQEILSDRISEFTYVDFCAGAGGPTPFIEQDLNKRLSLARVHQESFGKAESVPNGRARTPRGTDNDIGVDFVLTDIAPHLEAWEEAAKKSDNMHFIPTPVDAANAPADLLVNLPRGKGKKPKVFRLFNLAFHHFDDPLAEKILQNSIATSDGFGIFELQARTFSSFLTITLIWPLVLLLTPFYFWRSPGQLFFTYIIPIIPFVLVFDGYVSSLRTRSAEEIVALMDKRSSMEGWQFGNGSEHHTYPIGEMTWFIGVKKA